MADEFQLGSGSWWDNATSNRFDGETTPGASITTTLASLGWPTDMKSTLSIDSGGGSLVLQGGDQSSTGGGVLANEMVGLGLSSESVDWNQPLLGEKADTSFRSMLADDMSSNTTSFQENSSVNDNFKQVNRGFSLDQSQFSHGSSNDSYVGLLLSENQQQHENEQMNYPIYSSSAGYGANAAELINPTSWNKFPQFLRQPALGGNNHMHFSNVNNTPFWNASTSAMADARSSFFSPAASCFDEKPKKSTSEVRNLIATTTRNGTDQTSNKRARNEAPSPLPAFKVRKEKMGDRITALQQLVSPFGKTDTASVLTEAIEYIKFLHEQVSGLSSPYMKNGAPIEQHQKSDKSKLDPEGGRKDLRSRGLCLVPVSSAFPVTHETTVDFWTPTFGGSFR